MSTAITTGVSSLKTTITSQSYKKRFEELLGDSATSFINSVISLVSEDKKLAECDPNDIIMCAVVAAMLKLPINKNLGFAYIIPYKDNKAKKTIPQFQLGYKGFVQLALRTNLVEKINADVVREGEIEIINKFTEKFKFGERKSEKIIGAVGYIELKTGFKKLVFWSEAELEAHAKKYSRAYQYDLKNNYNLSCWSGDEGQKNAMRKKTVLKNMLSKYAPLSIDNEATKNLSFALQADQSKPLIDMKTGEITFDFVDSGTQDIQVNDTEKKQADSLLETFQ